MAFTEIRGGYPGNLPTFLRDEVIDTIVDCRRHPLEYIDILFSDFGLQD